MESESPPPPKRFRRITRKDINIPLIECKREFKLPQQFPSRVTYPKRLCNLTQPKDLNNPSSKGMFVTNDVKKMQLKSKDGKNLGEIKLKFLSPNLIGKTIDYNKLDLRNKINKPVTLSFKCSKKLDKSSIMQETSVCIKNVPDNVNSDKYNLENSESKLLKSPCTISRFLQNDDLDNNVTSKNMFLSNIIHCNKLYDTRVTSNGSPKNKNVVPLSTSNDSLITKTKDNIGNIKGSMLQKSPIEASKAKVNTLKKTIMKNNVSEPSILKVSTLETSTTKVDVLKQPIVKGTMAKKVAIKIKEIDNIINKTDSSKANFASVIENKSSKENSENIERLNMLRLDNSTESNGKAQTEAKSFEMQIVQDATVQNKSQISSISEDVFYNKEIHNTNTISCLKDSSCNIMEPKNKKSCFENTNNSTNIDNEETINEVKQQKLSQRLDIIKEALISVTDKELRAKALKALEDCGIGIAKHVPIIPPENLRTVHDSQIQTDVFGLLDLENFVLVKEDIPTLERIKQIEHSTTTPMTDLNIPTQPSIMEHNNFDNEYFSLNTNSQLQTNDLHTLDMYFTQCQIENDNIVNNVKRTLDIPYSLIRKVHTQLTVDYTSVHQWDNNGMLNIHRAVLDNDLQEVKRLLLVLKACKISIDVLTENEMTSLELAVQSEASNDIVQLLLDEGAKPVLPETAHESAIIIACKSSSSLLPILLQYVTDHELLNKVDSNGMAPIHYCALNGNLSGINALLKTDVDVNLKDNRSGRTAIFHALENNHVPVARKLLAHGAITSIKNFSGQSALTLVEETKNFSLKAALK
ncbi:uncharacterized protein LOC116426042 [Nomia melanderi]|uniref:uncharacterized protein LOC116426042 n=1 Tax=Nomia melanderi TaxID=2448451 RepID=UPI0013044A92|nr:uncharacterized protein LOC116426042 [Nomia melanderi]